MHILKRQALVPYSAAQLYTLVNDVENYPQFLPWCHESHILSQSADELTAELHINWTGLQKSFTTRNVLVPNERIEINLVNGPLKHLQGVWRFTPLAEHACKIELDLEFAFTGSFIDKLFQPVFQHIANTFVDAFVKRAAALYGKKAQ